MGTTSRDPQQFAQPSSMADITDCARVRDLGIRGVETGDFESDSHDSDSETEEKCDDKKNFLISPNVSLKDQFERDKGDESLRRWKEQLLGSVHDLLDPVEENIEPKVQVFNFTILADGRPEIVIPLPLSSNQKVHLFSLKEACSYRIKFTFAVRHNIVSGLTYVHTVWKNGLKVENTKTMLGTFAPQSEPHIHTTGEETTPSGIFARGSYTSRIRFEDDDGRRHLDIQHTFSISKEW